MLNSAAAKPTLIVRNASLSDVSEIAALSLRVYGEGQASTKDHIRGQLNTLGLDEETKTLFLSGNARRVFALGK